MACSQLQAMSPSARADAEILLAHCLQQPRTWLFTWPEHPLDASNAQTFADLLTHRLQGTPVAYLTGHRAFWTLDLRVTADTLIPRPETELLVETALQLLDTLPEPTGVDAVQPYSTVLDLGTGTGAIALAIASERPDLYLTACDVSASTLAIAKANAQYHGISNVEFLLSDWFADLPPHRYCMMVANPPYLAAQDPHLQQGDLRFEPHRALASGVDGLSAIRHIVKQAPRWLEPGGWLLLEHGYDQQEAVGRLLQQAGFQQVRCLPDLAGNPRITLGQH